jgi:hypothetical protein
MSLTSHSALADQPAKRYLTVGVHISRKADAQAKSITMAYWFGFISSIHH